MKAVIFGRTQYEEQGNGTLVPVAEVNPNGRIGLGSVSRAEALGRIALRSTQWRVKGILSADDYGVLAGPKGVGKTLALQDLGVSVALGQPWFGRFDTVRNRVLVLTSEDSEARLWRRFDAIAISKGVDPEALEGQLLVHPLPFNAISDAHRLAEELGQTEPGLVLLDPAYKYLVGARPSSLFDMGAALTPLQVMCTQASATLLVGHHYNRQQGRGREERISGAGLLEWARVVITAEAPARSAGDEAVNATFEITGNSVDPVAFTIRRSVVSLDDSPNPELSYSVEVTAEGAEAVRARFATAADRVLAVLHDSREGLTVREIGDLVAHDGVGKPLKADTISKALRRLGGLVDGLGQDGGGGKVWWRT